MLTVLVDNEQQAMLLLKQVTDTGLIVDQDFSCVWKPELVFSRHYDGHESTEKFRVDFCFRDAIQETFFRIQFK